MSCSNNRAAPRQLPTGRGARPRALTGSPGDVTSRGPAESYSARMVRLSGFEWLALATALLLCPRRLADRRRAECDERRERAPRSLFDRLDRNRDGYLSSAELASDEARQANWIAVDRNRDGRIGRGEFGLVGTAEAPPSAAAGGTRAPKKPE